MPSSAGHTQAALERSLAKRLGAKRAWVLAAREIAEVLPILFEGGAESESPLQLVETLGGPYLGVSDLPAMAAVARKRGKRVLMRSGAAEGAWGQDPAALNTLLVAENSNATCYGCAAVALGAHASFETLDLMSEGGDELGLLAFSADAERTRPGMTEAAEAFAADHTPSAAQLAALEAGLASFDARMRARCDAAAAVASFLSCHPLVERVGYPGLRSHPCFKLATSALRGGFGAWVDYLPKDASGPTRYLAGLDDPREQCMGLEAELRAR